MTAEGEHRHASTLRDYLNVARRRKWIILQAVVLIPLVAFFLSARHQKVYEAQAQVLLNDVNLSGAITGVQLGPSYYQTPAMVSQTQADIALTPTVANRAVQASGIKNRTGYGLLASSSVVPDLNSNLLYFYVTDTNPSIAAQLATAYAQEYTNYRRQLDTKSLTTAAAGVEKRLATLRAAGQSSSPLAANLERYLDQLRTLEALQTSNATVIRPAGYGYKVAPRPFHSAMYGLLLGLILGIGLAFVREALDTRVRSAEEIGERLGLPLLARLPEPPRRLRKENRLAMVAEPAGPQAEAFRMLRTNLDFARVDRDARTILVTSAVESEGKSTTAANLAVALARIGQRVVLVDLDLRRPFLHRFFDVHGRPGLTQVAVGHATLDEALAQVHIMGSVNGAAPSGSGNGSGQVDTVLEVLRAGPIPPNVDDFLGSQAVADILAKLRKRADVVLIDSTPLLVVGDAMALTRSVDALLVVTRLNVVRRPMMRELRRVLDTVPGAKLGFIVTGAGAEESYYGYEGYAYRSHAYARTKEPVA